MKRLFNFLRRLFTRRNPEPEPRLFPMSCTHEFPLKDWTDLNGDPRCIHCGKYFLDKILHEQPSTHFESKVVEGTSTVLWKMKANEQN